MSSLSLITAVLPQMSEHIAETEQSVREAKISARNLGWTVEWIVAVDGPGVHPPIKSADHILQLPKHSGVSIARNYALSHATGRWIMPLDGDDIIDQAGFTSILHGINPSEAAEWIGANRLLFDGNRTPHWKANPTAWQPGDLAKRWVVPFAFHPNSLVVRRVAALQVDGWPAVPCNEDLAFLLNLSEQQPGRFTPDVLLRYRVWEKQTIAEPSYAAMKQCAFDVIGQTLNAKREAVGRRRIEIPRPGKAIGNYPIGN